MANKNTICLLYKGTALEAARFYADTFPDSAVGTVHRSPGDYPGGKQGSVLLVEFTVMASPASGLTAALSSTTTRRSLFRSLLTTRPKPTACGMRSCAMVATRVSAAGVRTSGASHGKSPRAH